MKALKCKTLGAELTHAQYILKRLLRMTTIYLPLTLVGKGRQTNLHVETSMTCKWPTWPCESEKQAITRERKLLAKTTSRKPLEFIEDLAGKFNLLHTRRLLTLE